MAKFHIKTGDTVIVYAPAHSHSEITLIADAILHTHCAGDEAGESL